MNLHQLKCETCHSGDPSLTDDEIKRWYREAPKWNVKSVGGVKRLERVFTFSRFSEAMQFVYRVAELAEAEHHHPSILIEYDKVTLNWWTHKVRGLHLNDFIMAAKIDNMLISYPPK